jgi:hypothetical protein
MNIYQPPHVRAEAQAVRPPVPVKAVGLPLRRLQFTLYWASALVILAGIARELVIAAIGTETVLQDLRHFALDAERNIGAWYSSALMIIAAALLFCGGRYNAEKKLRGYWNWYVLSALFVMMSVDESVSFHEILIAPLQKALNADGLLYFAWVIPGSIFVLGAFFWFVPFLKSLPARTATGFFISGGIYVGGALGLEFVGGALVSANGWESPAYIAVALLEESLEIIGLTVFVAVLTDYLLDHQKLWRIM